MDILTYKRGQVWMCNDTCVDPIKQGVQRGTRPALIISNDKGNESNTTCIVIKITSRQYKSVHNINVFYTDEEGKGNVVLCNQVATVNKGDLVKYLYTLSDDIMDKVEKAYKLAIGMQETDIQTKIDEIYKILEDLSVIKSNEMHDVSEDEKVIRDTAKEIANIYNNLLKYHDSTAEQLRSSIPAINDSNSKIRMGLSTPKKTENTAVHASTDATEDSKLKGSKKSKRKPHGYWTKQRILQFIEDKDKLTLDKWMEKYEFTDRKSIMKTYYSYSYKVRSGKVG